MGAVALALLCLLVYYVVSKVVRFYAVLRSINFFPGDRWLFTDVASPVTFFLPWRIPYILPGQSRAARRKFKDYEKYGCNVVSDVALFPIRASFFVADADIIKEVAAARTRFPKPIELYQVLATYGSNIVVSEADEWKRFRKIANPGFSERNNRLVWEDTQRIVLELFEEEWAGKDIVDHDNVLMMTVSIALFVISCAGFGQRISWRDEGLRPAGYEFSFKETMYHLSTEIVTKAATPNWLLQLDLTPKMRTARIAFDLMEKYMMEMVQNRRNAETKEERNDLLSGLLDASDEEFSGSAKLTDQEVISNIFIFLIAGHETTAHTLAFAFILLALYPEEQDKLYQQCKSVLGKDDIPKYETIPSYTYAMAVFNETLRLYAPASAVPKVAAEDSVLYATNASGQKVPVVVPKGADILFHVPGLHYNPRYWEDPHAFKPSRFLKPDWPRDAFLPFSGGARSCIGRRFSEVEAVAVLTLFSLRYSIELKEEPQFANETFEERKERLLKFDALLTLTESAVGLQEA
ncbi:cytochrome P450 [Cytidiella melzeri]|nr:cytochrome P450 [Cytidiella melzeri]